MAPALLFTGGMEQSLSQRSDGPASKLACSKVGRAPASFEGPGTPGRVLVSLDGLHHAEAVVPLILRAVGRRPMEVVLLRMLEVVSPAAGESLAAAPWFADTDRRDVESLADVVARLSAAGVRAWVLTRWGSPATEIGVAALELGAEFIVRVTGQRSGRDSFACTVESVRGCAQSSEFAPRPSDTRAAHRVLAGAVR